MSDLSKNTLMSLRDFIGDALSDPDVTPQEIARAILDELTDLVEYHSEARSKAKETLSLFSKTDDISDAWDYFVKDEAVERVQDELTFGGYDFNLNSDYIKFDNQKDDFTFLGGAPSNDTINFTNYVNKKNKKDWNK